MSLLSTQTKLKILSPKRGRKSERSWRGRPVSYRFLEVLRYHPRRTNRTSAALTEAKEIVTTLIRSFQERQVEEALFARQG